MLIDALPRFRQQTLTHLPACSAGRHAAQCHEQCILYSHALLLWGSIFVLLARHLCGCMFPQYLLKTNDSGMCLLRVQADVLLHGSLLHIQRLR